jgi:hypothetical protein
MALKPPTRPAFNSALTSDRLREGFGLLPSSSSSLSSAIPKNRKSMFVELLGDCDATPASPSAASSPGGSVASPGAERGSCDSARIHGFPLGVPGPAISVTSPDDLDVSVGGCRC